jgi:hypothetical protein
VLGRRRPVVYCDVNLSKSAHSMATEAKIVDCAVGHAGWVDLDNSTSIHGRTIQPASPMSYKKMTATEAALTGKKFDPLVRAPK